MDPNLSVAVTEAFVQMFEKIHISCISLGQLVLHLNTAISDIEVDYLDIEKPIFINVLGHDKNKKYEFGTLTSFAYRWQKGTKWWLRPHVWKPCLVIPLLLATQMIHDTSICTVNSDTPFPRCIAQALLYTSHY